MNKCIVCGKEGAVVMTITDGYMETGKFAVCPLGCPRKIVSKGVWFWKSKQIEQD